MTRIWYIDVSIFENSSAEWKLGKKCGVLDKYLTWDGQEIDLSWPGLNFSTRRNAMELEQLAHIDIMTTATLWSENWCRGLSKLIGPEKGQILSIFKINRVVSNVSNSGPIPEMNSILDDLENVNTSVFWLRLRCFGRFYVLRKKKPMDSRENFYILRTCLVIECCGIILLHSIANLTLIWPRETSLEAYQFVIRF